MLHYGNAELNFKMFIQTKINDITYVVFIQSFIVSITFYQILNLPV